MFYGGAAGGGKSDWLLMGALEHVDIPGYAAIIFRRTFTDLALPGAVMDRSKQWLKNTDATWNEQLKQWRFPSGATLQFAYLKSAGDELRYQSAEFQYVGFDELTQFPEQHYTYLFSRIRRPESGPLSRVPLRMRAASNPGGIGHVWVKDRFPIDGVPRGRRVFIPAKIADNPHLDATAYRASLSKLGPALQRQLEHGDWEAFEGAAFTVTDDHLIDEFGLRDSHERFEAADYGLNGAPWALWCVDYEGNLVVYDMLYERNLVPSELAVPIKQKRVVWGPENLAFVDPSIWHRTGGMNNKLGRPAVLADEFTDHDIRVTAANNDPRAGMMRLRELLKPDDRRRFPPWHERAGESGAPRLFFVRDRVAPLVEELRSAPLQPIDKRDGGEIVDPEWESRYGHAVAMARYAVMTRPSPSEEPHPSSDIADPLKPEWQNVEELARQEHAQKFHGRRGDTDDDNEWGYDPDAASSGRYGYTT